MTAPVPAPDDVAAFLRAVRARLASGWTAGAFTRNEAGAPVASTSPDAVAFDLIGAVGREMHLRGKATYAMCPEAHLAVATLCRLALAPLGVVEPFERRHGSPLILWHDAHGRTLADVLALVDQALAEVSGDRLAAV